jgi:hypothetical protein
MAGTVAPNIVTDGLVLYLDAANTKSYPGSGTVWRDISRGGNNGTLINGPTFNSENGGSIVFDGVNDHITFANPLNQSQLNQVWTVQSWVNITTKPRQRLLGGLNAGLFIEYSQGNNSLLYLNSGANDYYTYGGQFTSQGWALATFRFNNATGNRQIWRNLSNISTTGPNKTSIPAGQSSTFTISFGGSDSILGKIANMLIYNKYLSDGEIAQNYNATKTRYGL